MIAGDVFYAKKIKSKPRGGTEMTMKGHAIGLLIGVLPENLGPIGEDTMWRLIFEAGLVGFDHINNALGEEAMMKVMEGAAKAQGITNFKAKYANNKVKENLGNA